MPTDHTALSELLYMSSIYRRLKHYDLAKKLLQDLLETLWQTIPRDNKSLGIVKYCLAEIFSDEKNYLLARLLYKRAAKNFDQFQYADDYDSGSPRLIAALTALENESQLLIDNGHQRFHPKLSA